MKNTRMNKVGKINHTKACKCGKYESKCLNVHEV